MALAAWALAGCVNLAPTYERPAAPVADAWPAVVAPSAGSSGSSGAPSAASSGPFSSAVPADLDWRGFVTDARLRGVIERALQNNRDLRIAVLNIETARARYRIERSALWPQVGAAAAGTRQHTAAATAAAGQSTSATQYGVELGLAAYELDVFGRVRNLSEAALQTFFATEEDQHSARISLVAETAGAWLTLAADLDRLRLARDTLQSQQASYELTRRTRELGGASGLTLAQARTTVDAARVDVARYTSLIAQDRNALELLAGTRLPDDLLPGPLPGQTALTGETGDAGRAGQTAQGGHAGQTAQSGRMAASGQAAQTARTADSSASLLVDVPAGLPAEVLQRRPDVRAAERLLRAANADIGAARAALFPSISLTAAFGTQSRSLGDLFGNGSGVWSFAPRIDLPIFDGGRRRADVQLTEAQQAIQLANYERAVQIAFREVADALAERGTLAEQLAAQQSLTEATQRANTLSEALFKNGASSYLDVLDAQRALYAAQQTSITLRLTEQANRITLYRVLGGG